MSAQIPMGLLLYSHIPTAAIALLFGVFLFYKSKDLRGLTLFIITFFFALWSLVDLGSWFSFLGADMTMFTWSLADFFSLVFFVFSYYFLYVFLRGKDLPWWQKIGSVLILIPTAWWTFGGNNLLLFDGNTCEAWENEQVTGYLFLLEGLILLSVVILTVYTYIKNSDGVAKRRAVLAGTGVSIFLGFFLSSTWLASYLVTIEQWADYAYNYEIYGLFGMPILIAYLGYLIVRYGEFNVRVLSAQAFVVGLLGLIAAEYAFVESSTNRVLVTVTLILAGFAGSQLIRGVKKEIALKEELAKANAGQERFIHFLSHEVKGFLTVARNGFASIAEGDFGVIPETLTIMAKTALERVNSGVTTVESILKSANLKSGNVIFKFAPFDICSAIRKRIEIAQPLLQERKLTLEAELPEGDYVIVGDSENITDHVLKNLIENAIFYTPQGTVRVKLVRQTKSILFSIKDTGVGLSSADKKRLFTEGGRGENSMKVNAHSTGHGLFIVKNIVDAHGGRVWAESEGEGKGTTFFVELPINPPAAQKK